AERGECGPGEIERHVDKRVQHLKNGSSHHFIRHRRNGQVYEMIGNPLPDGGFVTSFSDITNHISTQNALEEINMDLENRIEARTQEVQTINSNLQAQIDSRVQTEQALTLAKREAEQANDSKTRFLALASHDILQPLNAARLYLAAIDETQLDSTNKNNFNKLGDSLDSTVHLMSALLEIAKLEQGAMTPNPRHFCIDDILDPLKSEYAILSSDKGLSFKVRSNKQIVHSDITYLRRILQNLLSNAIKYTENGRVLIACRNRKHSLRIEVWDTGPGISDIEQAKIFNDFYRIEAGDNKGVGLGLGVVKRMADLLSLPIDVVSLPNKGSRFSIEVPYGDAQLVQQKQSSQNIVDNRAAINIIAVDDDPENLAAMASLLKRWQANYTLFDKVDAVLTYAKEQRAPDVILMDYQLGNDWDGITLIKALREIWQSDIPAILITAVRDTELKQTTKAENIHYLSKPVKPGKLKALLNHST
ncbi:MAG: ATP-binding protein, partial [Pseudoalteromonas sp.]